MLSKPTLLQLNKAVKICDGLQKDIAREIGCNATYLSQFLNGKKDFPLIARKLRRHFERNGVCFLADGHNVISVIPPTDSTDAINRENQRNELRRCQNKVTAFNFQQWLKKTKS